MWVLGRNSGLRVEPKQSGQCWREGSPRRSCWDGLGQRERSRDQSRVSLVQGWRRKHISGGVREDGQTDKGDGKQQVCGKC